MEGNLRKIYFIYIYNIYFKYVLYYVHLIK